MKGDAGRYGRCCLVEKGSNDRVRPFVFFAYIGLYNTLFIKLWSVYILVYHRGHKQAVHVLSTIQLQNTGRAIWRHVCDCSVLPEKVFKNSFRKKKCILEFVLSSWGEFGVHENNDVRGTRYCSRPRTKSHRNIEKSQILYFLIINYSN